MAVYLISSYALLMTMVAVGYLIIGKRRTIKLVLGTFGAVALPIGVIGGFLTFASLATAEWTEASFVFLGFAILMFFVCMLILWAFSLWGRPEVKRRWLKCCVLAILLASLPLMPYAVVEAQTLIIGPRLISPAKKALIATGWFTEPVAIVFYKVLLVTPSKVWVYIVSTHEHLPDDVKKCGATGGMGDVVELRRTRRGWTTSEDGWYVIWSDCGSADGNVFPPYPTDIRTANREVR